MAIRLIRLISFLLRVEASMKQYLAAVWSGRLLSWRLLSGVGLTFLMAGVVTASAQTPTGNPSTDGGWTAEGMSASAGVYNFGSGNYNATVYSTAFTLAPGSTLLSTLDGYDWNIGDTIVGVGGVFSGANSDLTYSGGADEHGVTHADSTSTRIVVKYGTSAATWTAPAPSSSSPGYGSQANGGVGSVLLGTFPYDFYPADSNTLVVPSDTPLLQTGPSSTSTITGDVGRVITSWNGTNAMVGFESFLDLTLLTNSYPAEEVALGNDFILDLQRGTSGTLYQDSLGTLPTAVPEPSTSMLVVVGLLGAWSIRRRKA
jgi:hypothetical protein